MNLNLTMEHLAAFVMLAAIATPFFKGWQLIRMIVWLGLWQMITPVRGWMEDGLMLGIGFWLTECSYRYVSRINNNPPRQ